VRAVLHSKAADVREARLGDVEGAIAHYRRVLELDESTKMPQARSSACISRASVTKSWLAYL